MKKDIFDIAEMDVISLGEEDQPTQVEQSPEESLFGEPEVPAEPEKTEQELALERISNIEVFSLDSGAGFEEVIRPTEKEEAEKAPESDAFFAAAKEPNDPFNTDKPQETSVTRKIEEVMETDPFLVDSSEQVIEKSLSGEENASFFRETESDDTFVEEGSENLPRKTTDVFQITDIIDDEDYEDEQVIELTVSSPVLPQTTPSSENIEVATTRVEVREHVVEKVSPLHKSSKHESAYLHVTGEAMYVDDLPTPQGMVVGMLVTSPIARGRILSMNVEAARQSPGIHGVYTAKDIRGTNDISPFSHDEPLLAEKELYTEGQQIALLVGDSLRDCRFAAKALDLQVEEDEDAILSLEDAIAKESFLGTPHVMQRGDLEQAFASADLVIEGSIETGGQDHFYLETHAALCLPEERDCFHIYSSTQHPTEVQHKVAEVLGISSSKVVVEVHRMGGGFGGKETQGAHFAALAALACQDLGRPVKIWLNRDQDMVQTGKRHPFYTTYKAGFTREGNILGVDLSLYSDAGWSFDLSGPILDRALFHADNAYFLPNLRFEGRVCRTNKASNTAFRGFGGPQGMVVIEEIINIAAHKLQLDPLEIRKKNFYGDSPENKTPYGQDVPNDRSYRIFRELTKSCEYQQRRQSIDDFNQKSRFLKRGLGYQPVKFGISFTNSMLNQAGAFINIYSDGSVQLNHGGTEMGQGLHTKMLAICAHELGVSLDSIRLMNTSTEKVPNTSATAASSGSDLNGAAVQDACQKLIQRLTPVAIGLLKQGELQADELVFEEGFVFAKTNPEQKIRFSEVTMEAYVQQISMSATGFYRTPNIHYNRDEGKGKPFHYFAYGAAVTEVEVNVLTGEHRVLRADILHDVGNSLVPSIDRGQIEGAYIQGLGWLTCEELLWSEKGQLRTHSPDTYKIPAFGEAPLDFHVHLLEKADQDDVIHGSKAVGEPPFMLAISVLAALRHAIQDPSQEEAVTLSIPCTSESILRALSS